MRSRAAVDDDLPSVNSHTDDEEVWSSDIGEDPSEVDSGLSEDAASGEDEPSNSSKTRLHAQNEQGRIPTWRCLMRLPHDEGGRRGRTGKASLTDYQSSFSMVNYNGLATGQL